MAKTTHPNVSPQEIAAIIQTASKEPGVNDVLALLQLSQEVTQIEQIRNSFVLQPLVAEISSTAGWIR